MKRVMTTLIAVLSYGLSAPPVLSDSLRDLPAGLVLIEPKPGATELGQVTPRFVHLSRSEREGDAVFAVRLLGPIDQIASPCREANKTCLPNAYGGLDIHLEARDGSPGDVITADIGLGGPRTIDGGEHDLMYYLGLTSVLMSPDINVTEKGGEWIISAPEGMIPQSRWREISLEDASSAALLIGSFRNWSYKDIGSCVMEQLAQLDKPDSLSEVEREMQAYRSLVAAAEYERATKPDSPDGNPGMSDAAMILHLLKFAEHLEMQLSTPEDFLADDAIGEMAGDSEQIIRDRFEDMKLAANYLRRVSALLSSDLQEAEKINIICTDIAGLEIPAP